MKALKTTIVIVIILVVFIMAGFFLIGYLKPKPGGILVDTTPGSDVYINGNLVGKTPYQGINIAGQISLKLVPIITDQNLIAYETKINLVPGIQTVVRREFAPSEEASSGDVISFNKSGGNLSGLSVTSTPDNSQVLLDGVAQGFSPYSLTSISSGSHQITVKSPGYTDRTMSVKTQAGYKLMIFAKLAKSEEIAPEASPSPTPVSTNNTYILIGNTPTGFLRMRTEPGTLGEEIAQLPQGSKYAFLGGDVATGWYKIQYEDPAPGLPNGIVGWVSNQYSSIIK
jgi:uncharacterized protein YgiM (DUF1202 family)